MKYANLVPNLPETFDTLEVNDEEYMPLLFKTHDIREFSAKGLRNASDPTVVAETGLPTDIVAVTVIKDYQHTVGKHSYRYKAMCPTTVPRHVAELLYELGLLYVGGVADVIKTKIEAREGPTPWIIPVPR